MKKILPPSLAVILAPIGLLLVLFVLIMVTLNIAFAKIGSQRDELAADDKNENILKNKEALLRDVAGSILSPADVSSSAVPDDNPALVVLAQLRNLAITKNVTLDNLKIGNPTKDKGSVQHIEVNFDVDGGLAQTLDFVASIPKLSPITTLDRIKMSQAAGAARLSVTLEAYWAPFPKTLPALTDPISELSSDDSQILSKLGALSPLPFSNISPTGPGNRADPFSL